MAALRKLGAPIDVVAESHQPEVLREMVRLGSGWTVLPRAQAEAGHRPLQNGRPLATRQLVVALRASAVRDPAVDLLIEQLDARPGRPHGKGAARRRVAAPGSRRSV